MPKRLKAGKYWTSWEVARKLKVSTRSVQRWVALGELKAVTFYFDPNKKWRLFLVAERDVLKTKKRLVRFGSRLWLAQKR